MKRHLVIPDTQCKKGDPVRHFEWLAEAIDEYKPDTVIHLGDHWDFPSLSSYDSLGSLKLEGARVEDDIEAGNATMRLLRDRVTHKCRKVLLHGNHESRLSRAVNKDPRLAGTLGFHLLDTKGWEVVPYYAGAPGQIEIDGVMYAHFFPVPNTGKPIGGTIQNRLQKIGQSFCHGHVQSLMQGSHQFATGRTIQGVQAGSCLTPDHKVLTADLRYIPLGDVQVGDKLVSFDETPENNRKRCYRTGTVEAVRLDQDQCFMVTLESGKTFKVTGDHLWLTRVGGQTSVLNAGSYMWRRTDQLRKGSVIPKIMDEWEPLSSYDAGWLAGIYDGEGSLYARPTTSNNGAVMALAVCQKPGLVLDKIHDVLGSLLGSEGLTCTNQQGVASLRIRGGARRCTKLLGAVRPVRLLDKFYPELIGSVKTLPEYNDKVVSIEPIGVQTIVRIAIDKKTMVVEGYGHHNCYLHDEDYKGPANRHWRGIVILNEVNKGTFCEMPLSVDYLCRKYEGMSVSRFLNKNYRDAKSRFSLARGDT